MREAQRTSVRRNDRELYLYREIPHIDFEVLQKGFGFLAAMVREDLPSEDQRLLSQYVHELFELEMRSLPRPEPGERHCEIEGTPYQFDVWVMTCVAEFIVKANSVDAARSFYRPIIELGPAGRYWVEDFLQTWVSVGLEMSADLPTFVK